MPGHQELFPPTKPAPYIPRGDRDQHGWRHLTPCQAAGLRAAGRHRQRQAPRPRRRSRRRHPVPPRLTTTASWCGATGAISCACWYIRVRVRANANAGLSPHPHPNPHPPEPDPGRARALLHVDHGTLPQPAARATARRPVQTKAPHPGYGAFPCHGTCKRTRRFLALTRGQRYEPPLPAPSLLPPLDLLRPHRYPKPKPTLMLTVCRLTAANARLERMLVNPKPEPIPKPKPKPQAILVNPSPSLSPTPTPTPNASIERSNACW